MMLFVNSPHYEVRKKNVMPFPTSLETTVNQSNELLIKVDIFYESDIIFIQFKFL